jgi:hypothetical protein
MVSFIRNVSFDCSDPYALARFWSAVVGHPVHPGCAPGDEQVVIEPPDGPRLFFQAVPEDKVAKNRMHVCLQPTDTDRDTEVDRLLAVGATMAADHRDSGWAVLRDPAGNEFCVTRSSAERRPWVVWRQDDNGNRFEVGRFGTRGEADEVAATMEARGHKQMYWVAPA